MKKDEDLLALLTERLDLEKLSLSIINTGKDKAKIGTAKEILEWLNTSIPLSDYPSSLTKTKSKINVTDLLETLRKKSQELETEHKEETTKDEEDDEEEEDNEGEDAEEEADAEEDEEEPEKAPVADLD